MDIVPYSRNACSKLLTRFHTEIARVHFYVLDPSSDSTNLTDIEVQWALLAAVEVGVYAQSDEDGAHTTQRVAGGGSGRRRAHDNWRAQPLARHGSHRPAAQGTAMHYIHVDAASVCLKNRSLSQHTVRHAKRRPLL